MQFLKGDIQEGILKAAEEVFLEKGYKDASMREIASRAGVTVSNIYHYFTNKDEIFRTILKPVLNDLYAMIYNHDADQMTIDVFMDSDSQKMSVREYIRLVSEHRDRLRLLLFQAQGSVLENFRSEYTDLMTRTISVFFQGMKQKYICPVVLPSRSDSGLSKYYSIAMACLQVAGCECREKLNLNR